MEKILLFHLTEEAEVLVKKLAADMRIKVITVEEASYLMPLEKIAKQQHAGPAAVYMGTIPAESLIVFCELSEKHLNRMLFALKQCRTRISYKAVLTETNRKWNPLQMYAEMAREKAMYEAGGNRTDS